MPMTMTEMPTLRDRQLGRSADCGRGQAANRKIGIAKVEVQTAVGSLAQAIGKRKRGIARDVGLHVAV
jgi:hypothetical protein